MADHATALARGTLEEIDTAQREKLSPPVRRHTRGRRGRVSSGQEGASAFEPGGGIGRSKQAVVPNLGEAGREDMQEEPTDEFGGVEGSGFAVAGMEVHAVGLNGFEALIGNGDAVRIATEILEDMLGPAEGAFGVDDPLLLVERVDESVEGGAVGERGGAGWEAQLAPCVAGAQRPQEFGPEQRREHPHRKEVALCFGGLPALAVSA